MLCILLKQLAFTCRYTDMVPTFGRHETELCLIYYHMLDYIIVSNHGTNISYNQQSYKILLIYTWKRSPLENCFGFIDGTVIEICRRKPNYQRIVYNRDKRVHSIKFQSWALPSDPIGNLYGPYKVRRHDCTMLHESSFTKISLV